MATINDGDLLLKVDEASEQTLTKGLSAALQTFHRMGVEPSLALEATWMGESQVVEHPLTLRLTDAAERAVVVMEMARQASADAMGIDDSLISFHHASSYLCNEIADPPRAAEIRPGVIRLPERAINHLLPGALQVV